MTGQIDTFMVGGKRMITDAAGDRFFLRLEQEARARREARREVHSFSQVENADR